MVFGFNISQSVIICHHIPPGIQAKFIDLTSLIRPEGYLISYSERPDSRFRISVCRPLETAENQTCTGSTACLVHGDDHFNVSAGERLGEIAGEDSNLHMEDGLLTVEYSVASGACEGARRTIKMHFLCPTGAEEVRWAGFMAYPSQIACLEGLQSSRHSAYSLEESSI